MTASALGPPARRVPARPAPNRSVAPSRSRAARPGPGTRRGPTPASRRRSRAPPCTERRHLWPRADESPLEPPGPGDLIDAWDDYRRAGDGHFTPRGLQEVLDKRGLDVEVDHGDRVGAGGVVLIVETFGTRNFYVLPSFNKSPRAVADWFDDNSGGALTARTRRLTRLAQGRWLEPEAGGGGRFKVLGRGEVG